MEDLAQLEALCERLYNSQDSAERAFVEDSLRRLSLDVNCISLYQYVLENARSPYALLFASSSLMKQMTEHGLPLQLHLQLRNHLISHLAARGPGLEPFVVSKLIRFLCGITKLKWFDDDSFKELVKDSTSFFKQETHHYAIGLKILHQLVGEMNQPTPGMTLVQHRKVASAFRDQSLLPIYQLSLASLFELKNDSRRKLQELALSLSLQCLSFDFIGTSQDESSDEVGTVQIPSSWRSVIEESSTVQIYFEYYAVTGPPLSQDALECLLRLASTRRGLFESNDTRMKFLASMMMGTKEILETGRGLSDHYNYNTFCRLLGRFKVHFQLSELASMEEYNAWISLVSEFTVKSLQSWQWASSSIHYLLGLWSRMVSAVPYLRGNLPVHLDEYVLRILAGFISSRFDSLQDGDDLTADDALDDIELMQDQLDFFPYLCRFQYDSCSAYIMRIMDPVLQSYLEGVKQQDHVDTNHLSIIETKLAWMVHIVASVLKTKQYSSGDSQELIDAELSARVFQLINFMDDGPYSQRSGELSKERLDLAVLSFFQCFKKSYVGDQAIHASKLYVRLSELLGIYDHLLVLDVIVRKLARNFKCYSKIGLVIDQTLRLLLEMASGYMTAKLLLKLDIVQHLLLNHSRENFPFLEDTSSFRRRTTFYYTIGSLMFMEDSSSKFKQSMDSFSLVLVSLESRPESMFRDNSVKYALIGLMRDLRGIAMAADSRKTYGFLFNWLYPAHVPVLLKATAHWADSPEVTTPLLKFLAELVLNKSQRLMFDSSSPNAILLFREVSKLVIAYGSRILSLPSQTDMYTSKYKGVSICLTILSRALGGNYVNFGVFELYGDRALVDALDVAFRMILSIPLADIIAYRKVARAYFSFMEVLLCSHIKVALNLDTTTFMYIIQSLHWGLKATESSIVSQCAAAVDHLATCYFNNILMGGSPASPALLNFAQHISHCSDVFLEILKTVLEIVLFEDSGNDLNVSRAMLSLIFLREEMYTNLKAQILASQPGDQQQRLHQCMERLMEEVNRSLESKNRDKFTRNVAIFRKEFLSK